MAIGPLIVPSRPKKLVALRLARSTFPVQPLTDRPLLLESREILVLPNRPLVQKLPQGVRPRTAISRTNRARLPSPTELRMPRHEVVLSIQGESLTRLRRATGGPSLSEHNPSKLNPPQPSLCRHTPPKHGRNVMELPPLQVLPYTRPNAQGAPRRGVSLRQGDRTEPLNNVRSRFANVRRLTPVAFLLTFGESTRFEAAAFLRVRTPGTGLLASLIFGV